MTALDMLLRLQHRQQEEQPRQQPQQEQQQGKRRKKQQQQQSEGESAAGQPRGGHGLWQPQRQKLRRLLRPSQEEYLAAEATSSSRRESSAFLWKKLRAAVTVNAAADLTCGLTWVAAAAWEACHLDGLLLLVAAGPVACSTFAASIWRDNACTGWHLLFAWQAGLPLMLLICCCVAVYCVARGRQQNGRHTGWQPACSQQQGPLLQQPPASLGCCCCCSSSSLSVFGGLHVETLLPHCEGHQKHVTLLPEQQQQQPQQHPQDPAPQASEQQQQKLLEPLQPQWVPPQSLSDLHMLPDKPLDKKERLFLAKPATCEEERNSSWRLAAAVGGYCRGERGLEDACSSFVSSDASGTTDAPPAAEAETVSAAVMPARDSSSSSSSSPVGDLECLRLDGKTETAADTYFSKLFLSGINSARAFVRGLSTRFSSVARQRRSAAAAGCCSSKPKTAADPCVLCHCCALAAVERSRDATEGGAGSSESLPSSRQLCCSSSSRDSSELQPKRVDSSDLLTVDRKQREEGDARESAATASARPESLAKFPTRARAAACGFCHKQMHAGMQGGDAAAPARHACLISPPRESSGSHAGVSSADPSRSRHSFAARASRSETCCCCCSGSPVRKAQEQRRGGTGGGRRGHSASSALVAALLLPLFICCWFPAADTRAQAAALAAAAHAQQREGGEPADVSGRPAQLSGGLTPCCFSVFSSGGGSPPTLPLWLAGPPPPAEAAVLLLRVSLSLLPAALLAGSVVSLLLWYSPPAAVRVREVVGLIGVYAAAAAATRWYASQQAAAAAAAALPLLPSREPTRAAAASCSSSSSLLLLSLRFLCGERGETASPSWTGRPGGAPASSLWEDLCLHSMCAAVSASCMALQLLYFHGCFRRAPACFSLVEGSLAAQLATGLTYLCAAYIYCCGRASQGSRRLSASSGESWWFDVFYSHSRSSSSADEWREGAASESSLASRAWSPEGPAAAAGCAAPAEAGWRSFAAHMWLLLLLLIACTLVLAAVNRDQLLPAQVAKARKKRAVAAVQQEDRANRRAEEGSSEHESLSRSCRKRLAILLFHFLLALVVYLYEGSIVDMQPPWSYATERKLPTYRSSAVITSSSTTRHSDSTSIHTSSGDTASSSSCGDTTSSSSCGDTTSSSSCGDTTSSNSSGDSWRGTQGVVDNAEIRGTTERPVSWLLHFIFGSVRHRWLLLLWFSLSLVGIPLAAATAARADFLESAASSSSSCLDCMIEQPAAWQGAHRAPACGKFAADEVLRAEMEESRRKKKSARLLKLFVRKLFHFLLVAVVTTGWYAGAYAFTALALCGLLWILVFCEYLRVSCVLPKLSSQLTAFFSRFVDCRDKNGLFLTHMYLLLGVALPFVAAAAQRDQPPEAALPTPAYNGDITRTSPPTESFPVYCSQLLSPEYQQQIAASSAAARVRTEDVLESRAASTGAVLTGSVTGRSGEAIATGHVFQEKSAGISSLPIIITIQSLLGLLLVGVGDAVAALVGVRWGGKKIPFTRGKTYLGAAAFFAAPALLLLLLFMVMTRTTLAEEWLSFRAGLYAMALATLFEAYTPDIDNCILSLFGVVAYNGALSFIQGWQNLGGEHYQPS